MTALYTALPPYARALDMTFVDEIDGVPVIGMPFADRVQGRPGFLHGGAISGLLEIAAIAAIHQALRAKGSDSNIKQVNVTVDFMRGGLNQMTYAVGEVTRLGRTMANVEARAWQEDRDNPIAMGYMHYLIKAKRAG
ncbi:PaaI family thioesterase [Sphingorhabdus sp. EL138]|uniref:PaaI family thioesterase n=1 Tax=Sphingorhabdus sp. EL138 TaxID=2073156 RepID=UPI0025DCB976|nr:PaaI family thioesterase [Sphingorhabdus sp. EL138]